MSDKVQLTGTNWCNVQITDQVLHLHNKGKEIMKMPIKKINNSTVTKNEMTVEFSTEDMLNDEDCLCEMRLFIPQQNADKENSDENEQNQKEKEKKPSVSEDESKENEEEEKKEGDEENEEEEEEPAQEQEHIKFIKALNQEIINKARIGQFTGESIVSFPEIQLVVPRGKYSLDIYKKSLRFHGTSYNYNIEFKNILKAFLLPLADEVHVNIVIALDQAIKQGNTVYPFLVMQFNKGLEEEVELRLNPNEIKEINDKLQQKYKGELHEIVATLLKFIVGVNIIIPGDFQSNLQQKCLKCTVKTNPGWLFPLSKSIIFIHKPVIFIHCSDITVVEFHRIGASQQNKLFDMKILMKNGNNLFMGFDMKELTSLQKYFQDRKIKIKKMADDQGASLINDEEDDENTQGKKQKTSALAQLQNSQDDEDDEEDDDFDANEFEEESDEDFDEDEPESEDQKPKKKKEKKPKEEKMEQEKTDTKKPEGQKNSAEPKD